MRSGRRRSGYSLFELILAIALSAALLSLIGTAITLYLTRVDVSRSRVEEAQLARSILAKIAEDIRGAAIYQPQDTSAIAQLMASSAEYDVDSIDEENPSSSSASSLTGMTAGGGSGSSGGGPSGATSSSSSVQSSDPDDTLPLGLSGSLSEIYVDVARLPRREELFATVTGYVNAPLAQENTGSSSLAATPAGIVPPTDLKSVHYFVRQGEPVASGIAAVSTLALEAQMRGGGLVRHEIPRSLRVGAEQSGDGALLEQGQVLAAPEVVHIEFRYFNGVEVKEVWDMAVEQQLPQAVEVRIWLTPEGSGDLSAQTYDPTLLAESTRQYRQTVFLPMALAGGSGSADSSAESSSSTTDNTGSTTPSDGSGSSFQGL